MNCDMASSCYVMLIGSDEFGSAAPCNPGLKITAASAFVHWWTSSGWPRHGSQHATPGSLDGVSENHFAGVWPSGATPSSLRTAAAELPTFSIAARIFSFETPRACDQYLSSSG
jgi:hypothetical protein